MSWIVLDASVTLSWCFPDEQTPASMIVLDKLKAGDQALVPAFWCSEVLNSLHVGERPAGADLCLWRSAISRSETIEGDGRCTIKVRCREPRRHQKADVCGSRTSIADSFAGFFAATKSLVFIDGWRRRAVVWHVCASVTQMWRIDLENPLKRYALPAVSPPSASSDLTGLLGNAPTNARRCGPGPGWINLISG